jgi:TRAP-type mannitol/chloroaromatic compound transport system substrate-binding protein
MADFTRRKFIGTAAVGMASAAISAPTIVKASTGIRWNMPTSWPRHLLLQDSATIFAEKLLQLTNGEFEIRVHSAGELVPPVGVFDAVQSGTVECAHSWSGYYIGNNSAFGIDGGLPFGMTAEQHRIWWEKAGGRELMQEVYDKFNMRSFLVGDTNAQMAGWFNKEINSLSDLEGMRLRIVGLAGRLYERLGAATQAIPGGEILTAMERGVIDGVQFNTPHDDMNLGLHDVAKYYYYPCWTHPSAPLSIFVNKGKWEGLPDDFKTAFEVASLATHAEHVAQSQNKDRIALKDLMEGDYGVEVKGLPEDVLEAAYKVNTEMMDEFSDENEDFDRIYRHWKSFLDELRVLHGITRYPLDQFAYRK